MFPWRNGENIAVEMYDTTLIFRFRKDLFYGVTHAKTLVSDNEFYAVNADDVDYILSNASSFNGNIFSYCESDPINKTDKLGNAAITLSIALATSLSIKFAALAASIKSFLTELSAEDKAFFETYMQMPNRRPITSPWDTVQACTVIAPGIYLVDTEGHNFF